MNNTLIHNETNKDGTVLNSIESSGFSHIPQTDALPGCATSRHNKNSGLVAYEKQFSNRGLQSLALSKIPTPNAR